MSKTFALAFLSLFIAKLSSAQISKDTLAYMMSPSDELVDSAKDAYYVRFISPPDKNLDKDLYIVRDFYTNGKVKLIAKSYTRNQSLMLQGSCISYFPNGRRQSTKNY